MSFHAVKTIYVWLFTSRLTEVLHANARLCNFKCNLETLAARAASALGAATLLTEAENESAFYSQAHPVFLLPRSKTSFIGLCSFILKTELIRAFLGVSEAMKPFERHQEVTTSSVDAWLRPPVSGSPALLLLLGQQGIFFRQ